MSKTTDFYDNLRAAEAAAKRQTRATTPPQPQDEAQIVVLCRALARLMRKPKDHNQEGE